MAWVRVRDKVSGQQKTLSEGVARMLRDKYEIVGENVAQADTEAEETEKPTAPNVEAATEKVADVSEPEITVESKKDETAEIEEARAKYEKLYGGKPHGRTRLETLLKLIKEKENAG